MFRATKSVPNYQSTNKKMKNDMKAMIYRCPVCGNVILKLIDSGIVPTCCNETMQLLDAHDRENLIHLCEHHLPDAHNIDDTSIHVQVGHTPHPMNEDHQIRFILLESKNGIQVRYLHPGETPSAVFYCGYDHPQAVYEYCNLHGLWGTEKLPYTNCCYKTTQ